MRIAISALLLLPAAAFASSLFDGTWKTRMDSMKTTGKPEVFAIADGIYTCSSCVPQIRVKADGTDQKVSGHAYYDTVAVKVLSPTSVQISSTKAGRQIGMVTYTVSADGAKLSGRFVDNSGTKTATGTFVGTRVAAGPPGSHPISGSWQPGAMTDANDATRTMIYAMTADGFSMHWNGQSYHAKFDGRLYPIVGDPGHTKVILRKIDDNTVEETDYRMGKVTDEIRLVASKDGKTIEITDKDMQHGQTMTFTLDKQP
jgi:hypothetical protein